MSEFNIVVATHPRAGTHLCIDTLCLNLRNVHFGLIRGQYPSLERLLLDHDRKYTEEWKAFVFENPSVTKIYKTHLMPEEIQRMVEGDILSAEDRRIVSHILEHSRVIYVYRDGRDALVSWYHYMMEAGGGLPNDLPLRMQASSFSEFLRMPNRYIPVLRKIQSIDRNRAVYWSAHVEGWLAGKPAHLVSFEKLRRSVSEAMQEIARKMGITNQLMQDIELPTLITEKGRSLPARLFRHWRRIRAEKHHRERGVTCYPPSPAYARTGGFGNWTRYFNEEDQAFFLRHAGRTMQKLGYIEDALIEDPHKSY